MLDELILAKNKTKTKEEIAWSFMRLRRVFRAPTSSSFDDDETP